MKTVLNSFGPTRSPNIADLGKARQVLPPCNSRMSAFGPSLYGTIIHDAATLLARVREKM